MKVYVYQLANQSAKKVSLAIGIDLSFWHEQRKQIQSITIASSINQAVQLIKERKKLPQDHLVSYLAIDWHRYQSLANQLFSYLQGRIYFFDEIRSLIKSKGWDYSDDEVKFAIQLLYLQDKVFIQPGVKWRLFSVSAKCQRCFANYLHIHWRSCATCGERCAMCNYCYLLGRSRSCSPLFFFAPPPTEYKRSIAFNLPHQHTEWQQRTIQHIKKFLSSNREQLLFWAVTGAGKTECMVPVIQAYLEKGKRVLWVTPRKDVVMEVAPRLKRIFPQIHPLAQFGGSSDRFEKGPFVIATAHQALRYVRYFDLGIVDEVDAFPLYKNQMLESGIQRALTENAKQILLTATPPRTWKRLVHRGKLSMVVLPVRYHGHPLPVPIIKIERELWKKGGEQGSNELKHFIRQVLFSDGQAILFVPRLQDIFHIQDWLKKTIPNIRHEIAGVYSQDPKRDEKILSFRQGKIRFLVSTTILERGVTVERIHVAVLNAEHTIFDQASLIQIAGRVGRTDTYQQGQVWFIAQEKTEAQLQAIQEIKRLNKNIKKEGINVKELYYL